MYQKNKERRKMYKKIIVTKDLYMTFIPKAVVFLFCLIILFNNSALARDKSVFNIDMYYGWSGYFRPMEWTPVEITVNNSLEKIFNGELILSSQQDGLNTLNILVPEFVLTPQATRYQPLVTKMAFSLQGCNLKLDQVNGRRRKTVYNRNDNDMMTQGNAKVVNEYDMLIGVIGAGKFGLLRLEKQSLCQFKGINGNIYVGHKIASLVPWDWTGFVSLDLLVLYNPDWDQLKEQQLKAIVEWISNGGKMLLILGSKPPMGENPLTEIIPFDYMDAKEVSISRDQLYKWNLSGNSSETVTLRPLVPKPNARFYQGDSYQDNQYLFAVGNVGFGMIGVLGFDPDDLSASQDINSSRFWVKLIQTILKVEGSVENSILAQRRIEFVQDPSQNPGQPGGTPFFGGQPARSIRTGNSNYYEIESAYSMNNRVMIFLYKEIKPLSVWFVILLLGTLAVLLGPVDYKFLKHIDRLPLTWLTCSFWIILFTVGAYYGVQYIRGGKMQLRVVSVIDGIKGYDKAWATHYSGLFASRSDSYKLERLQPDEWWSGIAPTQDQVSIYSSELGSRRIYCIQEDGGNLPESLPVNIWDIQCMLTESPIEKMPFNADVKQNEDEIVATIYNESDADIISGYVLVDKGHGIRLGKIPAHDVREFRQPKIEPLGYWDNNIRDFSQTSRYSGRRTDIFRDEAAFFAQGSLQRTQAINNFFSKGAAVVHVTYDKAPVSFRVKNHSVSEEHIQLVRLVVFPN